MCKSSVYFSAPSLSASAPPTSFALGTTLPQMPYVEKPQSLNVTPNIYQQSLSNTNHAPDSNLPPAVSDPPTFQKDNPLMPAQPHLYQSHPSVGSNLPLECGYLLEVIKMTLVCIFLAEMLMITLHTGTDLLHITMNSVIIDPRDHSHFMFFVIYGTLVIQKITKNGFTCFKYNN